MYSKKQLSKVASRDRKWNNRYLFKSNCLTDYAFEFPNKGVADFVQLWSMRSFEQFTVCFWMQSSDQSGGTPFSYAVPGADNELVIITSYNNFTVWIGNEKR